MNFLKQKPALFQMAAIIILIFILGFHTEKVLADDTYYYCGCNSTSESKSTCYDTCSQKVAETMCRSKELDASCVVNTGQCPTDYSTVTHDPSACSSAYTASKSTTDSTGCTTKSDGTVTCKLTSPISATSTVPKLIGTIIKGSLGIIGALTLLMFVWGSFGWLTSAGNAEKVQTATKTMLWAAIGVLVVFASYIFLSAFLKVLGGG